MKNYWVEIARNTYDVQRILEIVGPKGWTLDHCVPFRINPFSLNPPRFLLIFNRGFLDNSGVTDRVGCSGVTL